MDVPWLGSAFEIDPGEHETVRTQVFEQGQAATRTARGLAEASLLEAARTWRMVLSSSKAQRKLALD